MKKAYAISIFCALLFLFITGSAMAQIVPGCTRAADEVTRLETARAILVYDGSNYESVINYWADDIIYREPVLTNSGRQEMLDYLAAMFGGTTFGFPVDRVVTIKNELWETDPGDSPGTEDDRMTYIATIEWAGTFGTEFVRQTGMSIIEFLPGEGCPSVHRDYWSEGDIWWNVLSLKSYIQTMREIYIGIMGLTGRCFDDDFDGYTKYAPAAGCPNAGLDCNDFVPEINPGAAEIPGNGIDDDCNPLTSDDGEAAWGAPASVVNAEYKEPSDITNYLLLLCLPFGVVVLLRGLRRRR